MKVIIAGSRTCTDKRFVEAAIKQAGFEITEVVCGGAKGVDTLGFQWAFEHNIPRKVIQADWNSHGRSAGAIRNNHMADYADALIAVWNGKSPGTKHMINAARLRRMPTFIYNISDAARCPPLPETTTGDF